EKLHAAGVFGVKAFMSPSGVPEFPHITGAVLDATLAEVARLNTVCLVHAEDPAVLAAAPAPAGRSYRAFVRSRPGEAEHAAVRRLVAAVRRTGARVHVLHASSGGVVPIVAEARSDGLPITAETCPHYLVLTAEEIDDGD